MFFLTVMAERTPWFFSKPCPESREGFRFVTGCLMCDLTASVCVTVCMSEPCRGSQYSAVAEEIKGVASEDPVHRKLFVRGLAWETTSETLCAVSALLIVC